MEEQQDMSLISTKLSSIAWPNVFVRINSLVPCNNPVCINRHSLSNRFAIKANYSFANSL